MPAGDAALISTLSTRNERRGAGASTSLPIMPASQRQHCFTQRVAGPSAIEA